MLNKLKALGVVAFSALCLVPNSLTAQEVQAPTASQQAHKSLYDSQSIRLLCAHARKAGKSGD